MEEPIVFKLTTLILIFNKCETMITEGNILRSLAILIILSLIVMSCQKRPLNSRNDYIGEWEFTEQSFSETVVGFDSNGVASSYDRTTTLPETHAGSIKFNKKDILLFDFNSREREYAVSKKGKISNAVPDDPRDEDKPIQRRTRGEFIGDDSLFIEHY